MLFARAEPQLTELSNYVKQRREYIHIFPTGNWKQILQSTILFCSKHKVTQTHNTNCFELAHVFWAKQVRPGPRRRHSRWRQHLVQPQLSMQAMDWAARLLPCMPCPICCSSARSSTAAQHSHQSLTWGRPKRSLTGSRLGCRGRQTQNSTCQDTSDVC